MEENVRVCDICGTELEDSEGTWVGNQLLCEDCVDEHCTTCDHCGETIWVNDSVQDDSITLCHTCYDDYYHRCECCNRIVHDNNVNWRGDYPYCDSCYDDFNDEIEEYSYKPEPIFYGDSKRYLGVELEVDCGGKDDDNASTLKEIGNACHEHIYIKSDGSIDDGFEIVSHPMTLNYHKHDMNWETVLHEAIKMGYRSHQTSTCGLHITNALIERSEALEQRKSEIQAQLAELRRFEPLRLEEYLHLIDDYKNMQRNTEEFRTFVQTYIDKVVTYPYHIEIVLDVGFGVTDELKETITIRRGDLYALFESRTED